MDKEEFLNYLEHSLSKNGYNTTHGDDYVFFSNEEMECEVNFSKDFDDEVWLRHIETKNYCIVPYKYKFIISDYDSVEELSDNIIEVVKSYSGIEAKIQEFTKYFIKSMNSCGCSRVVTDRLRICFTYRGFEWMIWQDFSQVPNDIWCFSNGLCVPLIYWNLKFDLELWLVKDIVKRILYYIDCYLNNKSKNM